MASASTRSRWRRGTGVAGPPRGCLRSRRGVLLAGAALACALIAHPSLAFAATSCSAGTVDRTWIGATSADWFTTANWSPAALPTASADVCVPAGTAYAPTVSTGAQANAASIESSEPVSVGAGKLKVFSTTKETVIHGELLLAGGTFEALGPTTVHGNVDWGGGSTIAGTGVMTIASDGTLTASGESTSRELGVGTTLHIDGTATLSGSTVERDGFLTLLLDRSVLEIGSGGTLDVQDAQGFFFSGEDLTRIPLIHVLPGGTLTRTSAVADPAELNVTLDNDGTVDLRAGTLQLRSGLQNYDPVNKRLIGGKYVMRNGAHFASFGAAGVQENAAEIILDGPGSALWLNVGGDALASHLAINQPAGILRLRNGRNLTTHPAGLNNRGTLDLGASTRLLTTGTFNQEQEATLKVAIDGTGPGAGYGQVAADTDAFVRGALEVDSTYVAQTGDAFDVVTAGRTRRGVFEIRPPGYDVKYLADRVRLTGQPRISVADPVPRSEGATLSYTATLSQPSERMVAADFATADGTAAAPGDYVSRTGRLSFAPGETETTVRVVSAADSLDEVDETVLLGLSNPTNATVVDGSATGLIRDDDPSPALTVADAGPTPEAAGSTTFDVGLSSASGKTVTVDFATADGTAHGAPPAADYGSRAGTLTFAPGDTLEQVTVEIHDDALDEIDELFRLNLANPVNAAIADRTGGGTIADDDVPPEVSIVDAPRRDEGGPAHVFAVTLSAPSERAVSVDYATADGSAVAPVDYGAVDGTLRFAPGRR